MNSPEILSSREVLRRATVHPKEIELQLGEVMFQNKLQEAVTVTLISRRH